MTPEEKQLLTKYAGLDALTAEELDQLCTSAAQAIENAARLPNLSSGSEPAHIFFVPQAPLRP
jgi:hypothetical protein